MNSATLPIQASEQARRDFSTIGLIGLAHGTSHFFHMLLPPLFPAFMQDFGLSYSQLGLLVTTFFIISGLGQAMAGFLVDRTGARPVLFAALSCFVLASLAAAMAGGFGGLMLAAALAGLGNAPFHPADFTILNKRVSQPRLGHAFSVHGITGNLGWALAPVFAIGISELSGSWRYAYLGTGLLALLVLALLWLKRDAIDDSQGAWSHDKPGAAAVKDEHPMAFLRLPSVWLCFSFFFFGTAALTAIQSFASPALAELYGLPLKATAFVVTGYMLSGAIGMVIGGFWVAKSASLERNITIGLAGAAALLALAATGLIAPLLAAMVVAVAGFGTGLAGPSRDMLIKRAAPPGATGRVYGTVYSGLDLGFAVAAPIFGALMDRGQPSGVFYGAALALLLAIGAASLVGWVRKR
ncbi:MFS transporter [Roseateles oligotrophus]|uniref:MFS transporter n=1 Tax=Roseateles oligotrophus TaxID=1769250 RepID=A0ABT2Y9G4_9BURK|nr:MFS transporter [Roseateles oligotrophus]MCV2366923.1 MFS transporter [Roseateles oligotrophus]